MNKAKSEKTVAKQQRKDCDMKNTEIERALEKNDEIWMKRMLLLVLTMIIAFLGLD